MKFNDEFCRRLVGMRWPDGKGVNEVMTWRHAPAGTYQVKVACTMPEGTASWWWSLPTLMKAVPFALERVRKATHTAEIRYEDGEVRERIAPAHFLATLPEGAMRERMALWAASSHDDRLNTPLRSAEVARSVVEQKQRALSNRGVRLLPPEGAEEDESEVYDYSMEAILYAQWVVEELGL